MKIEESGKVIRKEEYRALLIAVEQKESIANSLDELESLAESAGAEVVAHMVQKLSMPDSKTYIGSGKLVELKEICTNMNIDTVITNDELSPSQIRNLSEVLDTAIIDRTTLILDIFASRANTKEGKLQVELAQLKYRLPRLKGIGTALSRLGGGIGTRGPGEKKLESDRRHIERRMDDIKKSLKEVENHREVQRNARKKRNTPLVAIVGYTNAGKSATMNKILEMTANENREHKEVIEKDQLFATLDTYQRRIKLETNEEFILVDTVGFVSKLPHDLVEAFKATLEEVKEADLLIHVVDASCEDREFQIDVVERVLDELGADSVPDILVYNKTDIAENVDTLGLNVSAKTGYNMDVLLNRVRDKLFGLRKKVELLIPFDRGDITSYLLENTKVIDYEYTEMGTEIKSELSDKEIQMFAEYVVHRVGENSEK